RHAAARRARAGVRDQCGRPAHGRAVLGARPAHPPQAPGRAAGAPGAGQEDHPLRQSRSRRGPEARRQGHHPRRRAHRAGGHGLGAAYYLASEHRLTNIAVLEKGWIGGGNTGRNTTIIRSNYLWDESAALYEHALKIWEDLAQALNYNLMFSQRGVLMLAHTVHDAQVFKRHVHANRANGIDNEWITPEQAKAFCPPLNIENIRYPVLGAALQRRGGTARHDAVAWGYARAADALGVDIIENCEVTGIRRDDNGAVAAVETTRGTICALFPMFRRLRMLRNWGGIVDVTPDRSPIIGLTPVPGLYVNCGWGTGGFKATPGSAHVFAWTIARGEPHPINAPFTLERFRD